MSRTTWGVQSHNRHKKVLEQTKGYRGRAKTCYKIAINRLEKGLQYAYRDRRAKKRNFRSLWIQRINAGAREHGLTYSQFICGLTKVGITLDRKVLSDLAIHEPEAFKALAEQAKIGLKQAA